ncbi:hypothetical protein AB0K00_50285 [Dactylosporangium sp. NPDC049525]|uniref:hypothetical protein n=1 Tax=Dactylosporangium sp. NPDC049525 TaxID=3154730 RepID=UPI00342A591A
MHAPTQVGFDGRGFDGLPDRMVPLHELRRLLLAWETPVEVRDAVWRELVGRARRDGPAWVIGAVGVAMPGLRRVAGILAAGWRGDTDDLDSELIVGFVARLQTVDVEESRICGRLIDAGVRAARKARDRESDAQLVRTGVAGPLAPLQPWDHPDLVLVRAVAAGVLDAAEAMLIGATRLGETTLAQSAEQLGISAGLASSWRRRAEERLAAAIHAGDLAFVPIRSGRRDDSSGGSDQIGGSVQRTTTGSADRVR